MRNIAIFVSGEGDSTLRIVNLFSEGNRVKPVLVVATASAVNLADKLTGKEVIMLQIPDDEWNAHTGDIENLLRDNDIKLIVKDGFEFPLTPEMEETVNGKVISVSSADQAPREVVAALEAELRNKTQPEVIETPVEKGDPTPEEEWAESLKINFTPPKLPTTPPPTPEDEGKVEIRIDPDYATIPPQPQFHQKRNNEPEEVMPPTYLIWSILCAVFCCFIPGIVAIVFSSQVSSRYYSGDIEGAKRASRMAEIWIIASVVIGVVSATLYFPFMLIS